MAPGLAHIMLQQGQHAFSCAACFFSWAACMTAPPTSYVFAPHASTSFVAYGPHRVDAVSEAWSCTDMLQSLIESCEHQHEQDVERERQISWIKH